MYLVKHTFSQQHENVLKFPENNPIDSSEPPPSRRQARHKRLQSAKGEDFKQEREQSTGSEANANLPYISDLHS